MWTDGQTDNSRFFCNFANATKKGLSLTYKTYILNIMYIILYKLYIIYNIIIYIYILYYINIIDLPINE